MRLYSVDDKRIWKSWLNENWQGKLLTRRKTFPGPLCTPQIPHDMTIYSTYNFKEGKILTLLNLSVLT
jgi:hypothetical protein